MLVKEKMKMKITKFLMSKQLLLPDEVQLKCYLTHAVLQLRRIFSATMSINSVIFNSLPTNCIHLATWELSGSPAHARHQKVIEGNKLKYPASRGHICSQGKAKAEQSYIPCILSYWLLYAWPCCNNIEISKWILLMIDHLLLSLYFALRTVITVVGREIMVIIK